MVDSAEEVAEAISRGSEHEDENEIIRSIPVASVRRAYYTGQALRKWTRKGQGSASKISNNTRQPLDSE